MKRQPKKKRKRRSARLYQNRKVRRTLSTGYWLSVAAAMAWPISESWAEPVPTSSSAGVEFNNPTAGVTNITAPNNAIINYSSFNVASHETVNFIQPGPKARVLNRIRSNTPSQIAGTLTANGIVYLVNPAGVTFGPNSVVDVAGLFAAAGNLSDTDFLNNVDRFTDLSGSVSNLGTIQAQAITALIGRDVTNGGSILAPAGTVVMAAGDQVLLGHPLGGVMVSVESSHLGASDTPDATQISEIAGGIDQAGQVKAPRVSLVAGDLYSLAMSGTIDATGDNGGDVVATGHTVSVTGSIDASGVDGGGTVLIGGDYQGQGDTKTATRTYIGPDAVIQADAIDTGDGGRVIVWADDQTKFTGHISARGGADSGDGGFVEVSGKSELGFYGQVDVNAQNGAAGIVLLDPRNITIVNGSGAQDDNELDDGEIQFNDRGGDDLVISEQALEMLSGSVTLSARGSIVIEDLSDNVLDLQSIETITFAIGEPDALFAVQSGDDVIRTNGGDIILNVFRIELSGGIETNGGDLTRQQLRIIGQPPITFSPSSLVTGSIDLGDGSLLWLSDNEVTIQGDIIAGTVNIEASGGSNLPSPVLSVGNVRTTGDQIYSGTTSLSGNLVTQGGSFTFHDPVTLAADIIIDTTNGGVFPAGADVALTARINASTPGGQTLTIEAGSEGSVRAFDQIGNVSPLASLIVSSTTTDILNVNTVGEQSYTTTTTNDDTGDLTLLRGNLASQRGVVTFNTRVLLGPTCLSIRPMRVMIRTELMLHLMGRLRL